MQSWDCCIWQQLHDVSNHFQKGKPALDSHVTFCHLTLCLCPLEIYIFSICFFPGAELSSSSQVDKRLFITFEIIVKFR